MKKIKDIEVKIAKVFLILIFIGLIVYIYDYQSWKADKVKCDAGWLSTEQCLEVDSYTPYLNR